MKRKVLFFMLCAVLLSTVIFPLSAHADIGPKPSVRITFQNMGDELCYGTLLSEHRSTGPYSAWDGEEEHIYHNRNDLEIFRAFAAYEDADGFYYLKWDKQITDGSLAWTYYPPSTFKVLLYYPESGRFAVSGICEAYAFDSYFTVDMDGVNIGSIEYDEVLSTNERMETYFEAYRSYDYKQEILSLIARIVMTILIEMVIALAFFSLKDKKLLLTLVCVNTLTQVVLNLLLNIVNYRSGEWAFIANYILLELIVIVIEAVFYAVFLRRQSTKKRAVWYYILYAVIANVVSFITGMLVARFLPGIF